MTRILNDLVATFLDYPDNFSIAVCVVMVGCDNNCPGCQNPLLRDPNCLKGTREITKEDLVSEIILQCNRNVTNKIVLSGGDPLFPGNLDTTKYILEKLGKNYDICIYSGHDVNYARFHGIKGFKFLKVGYYDQKNSRISKKDDYEIVFASPNQELYDENYKLLSKDGVYEFKIQV